MDSRYTKEMYYSEGGKALEQVAWRDDPFLGIFKVKLDGALSNLIYLKMSLVIFLRFGVDYL